ncbi:MAG: hypothetical protein A3H27_06460 [Acidobacteria bacterium RIFCSPLOWO2_02_FULL_59_13]|nr:MAG: hypothetical protein A3H27_06460 [Acidobacteria bacterium RIFCSPLOWO2_02_FULL_59_13]
MNFMKMATIGLVIGLVAAGTYLIVNRRPNLQARVYVKAVGEGFPLIETPCPSIAIVSGEEEADYTLSAYWHKEGWYALLIRRDGAGREFPEENPDAAKVLRQTCRTIEKDFPAWLSTERQRVSARAQMQTASLGLGATDTSDVARRYELKEYRHGSIVGLALVDTELGRTWVLTDLFDDKGKKVRSQFQEVGVEKLWETNDEAFDLIQKVSDEKTRRFLIDHERELTWLKELTRPRAIQEAEEKASKRGRALRGR